jgi:hypothetical protein
VRLLYPTPDKIPKFIGFHLGNDQSKFQEKMQAWFNTCPDWKRQYQPFILNQRIDYNGSCDLWLIRTNVPLSGPLTVYRPPIIR